MGKKPMGRTVTPVFVVNDGSDPIPVVPGANSTTFATGQTPVPTPGTAENLAPQAIADGDAVVITALPGNSGTVWIGNSQANAHDHTVAYPLIPGTFLRLFITNTNLVWVDADNAGEGVAWAVET